MADEKPTTVEASEPTTSEPTTSEPTTSEPTTSETREEKGAAAVPTAEAAPGATLAGAGPEGGPVPGDPTSEPVATAEQSHVAGRVGPPTIQQDANAPEHTGEGVEQIAPGEVRPAETVAQGGPVPEGLPPAVVVAAAADEEGTATSGATSAPASPAGPPASSPEPESAADAGPADSATSAESTSTSKSKG